MRTFLFVVASLVATSTAACSSGSTGVPGTSTSSSAATSPASFCASICARQAECDRDIDKQTCERGCTDDEAVVIGKLRPDVIEATRSCYASSDCKAVLTTKRLSGCVSEAEVSVAPGDAAKRFCDAFMEGSERCNVSIDRAKCLGAIKLYSDEALDAAAKCTNKSCSAMGTCIDAELDLD